MNEFRAGCSGLYLVESENLEGQIFYKLLGQCVPEFHCPLAELFSMCQVTTIAFQLHAMHLSKSCFCLLDHLLSAAGIWQNHLNRKYSHK